MDEKITIKIIDEESKGDINIPNEPFRTFGRMIPKFDGESWSFETVLFPEDRIEEGAFPDENYDFDAMKQEHLFVGAYDESDRCVGLAIYRHSWNRYLYLHDLKVNRALRGRGIGGMLVEKGMALALEHGYRGVCTIGQDNNLAACRFYIKQGFAIGGFDNRVYTGTAQAGKADICFYRDGER